MNPRSYQLVVVVGDGAGGGGCEYSTVLYRLQTVQLG